MRNQGFIALTSAIIISVLLLAITLAITFSGFFARFNVLDSESKERSVALAEACADTAISDFAQGVSYTNPISVGTDHCDIVSITDNQPSSGKALIKTQAVINRATTDLKIQIDNSAFIIYSWEECTNFTVAPGAC